MTAKRAPLPAILLALAAAACGGGDKKDTTTPTGGGGADEVADQGAGGGAPALPAIPGSPAPMPDAVMATFSIGKPQAQLNEMAAYVDAISPGMGAMVGANLLPGLAGVAGAPGLDGYDLARPLHVVLLDPRKGGGELLLVVGVADEQRLVSSVGGTAQVQVHQGFAAIGKPEALVAASPYALSNLARSTPPDHPHAIIHVGRIVDSYGDQLEQQIRGSFGSSQTPGEVKAAEGFMNGVRSIERVEASFQASAKDATISVMAHPVAGSTVARFSESQKPADFAVADRLPKGPWMMLAAGSIDTSAIEAFLTELAAAQDTPSMAQYFPLFGNEMALGLFVKEDEALRMSGLFAVKPGESKKVATMLAEYVKTMAKEPKPMDSMQVTGKLNAYRTGGAALHQFTIKPGKDATPEAVKEFEGSFGKGGLVSFFGVSGDWVVFTLDKAKGARPLAAQTVTAAKQKKPKSKLGAVFQAAIEDARARGESAVMVFDLATVAPDPAAAKGAEVTVGLGFEGPVLRSRITIPPATGRMIMQQQMRQSGMQP